MSQIDPTAEPTALRYAKPFQEERLGDVWRITLDWIPPGSQVLDVGCASGYVGELLSRRSQCEVDGIEADAAAAEQAARTYRSVWVADLDDDAWAELPDARYDFVLALDVIEHLKRPGRLLRTARRFLKPGGRLVVSVPNIAFYRVRRDLLRGRFDYTDTGIMDRTHLHFYTRKSIRQEICGAGYAPIDEQFTYRSVPFRKLMPHALRRSLIRWRPGLFAYQFLVLARPTDDADGS